MEKKYNNINCADDLYKASKTIAQKIKFWRNFRNMSQTELAYKLNISSSYISQIESGRNISLKKLKEIAQVLDIEVIDLITYTPDINLIIEIYKDKSLNINERELKDLLSINIQSKTPTKNFYIFILELIRAGRIFFK
jgi:transcriptional regulator with XRE-family HTH domain